MSDCLPVCACWSLISVFLVADPMEDLNESAAQTSTNSAAELLKQGAGTGRTSTWICVLNSPTSSVEMAGAFISDSNYTKLHVLQWIALLFSLCCVCVSVCVCARVPEQRVTCGTWARWRSSLWRDTRRFRRRPRWRSPWTPCQCPPSSTSKCRPRASRSQTTRGSECPHTH